MLLGLIALHLHDNSCLVILYYQSTTCQTLYIHHVMPLTQSVSTIRTTQTIHACRIVEHLIPHLWALICYYSSTLLWRLLEPVCRNWLSLFTTAFVRTATDVGRWGLAHTWYSSLSERCCWGSLQASQDPPHQTVRPISLWTSICTHWHYP